MTPRPRDLYRPAVLLDRDGVLNVDRPQSVTSLGELELLPGAREGVALLADAGYLLIVVTNQACVGRGRLAEVELDRINAELNRMLGGLIAEWYVCPHAPEDACDCRKPKTELLERACVTWRFDPARTWLVADDVRDVEAAQRFGCRPVLVRTGKGETTARLCRDVPIFDDLVTFARSLIDSLPGA